MPVSLSPPLLPHQRQRCSLIFRGGTASQTHTIINDIVATFHTVLRDRRAPNVARAFDPRDQRLQNQTQKPELIKYTRVATGLRSICQRRATFYTGQNGVAASAPKTITIITGHTTRARIAPKNTGGNRRQMSFGVRQTYVRGKVQNK